VDFFFQEKFRGGKFRQKVFEFFSPSLNQRGSNSFTKKKNKKIQEGILERESLGTFFYWVFLEKGFPRGGPTQGGVFFPKKKEGPRREKKKKFQDFV